MFVVKAFATSAQSTRDNMTVINQIILFQVMSTENNDTSTTMTEQIEALPLFY